MKSCAQCGFALETICTHCKCVNPSHFKFCGECGQPLVTPPSTQKEIPVSEGERKHITVLFSDLSGYTSLSEKLDPEEVKGIMNRIFNQITKVVYNYEGTIEKFIGDAVVVFFGIPKAHEDDPIRAIRTALDVHEIVHAISPEFEGRIKKPLALHTGINTGLAVTGKGFAKEEVLAVAGDSVNVASRLSKLARPGEILVGEDTYHQTKRYFTFETLAPAKITGKAEPVIPYRVIKESVAFSRIRGLATQGISSPVVGRDAEFVAMKGCVNRLLNGQGGILSIIGEAGLGKSRLVAELRNSTIAGDAPLQWLRGHTLSYGKKISYWPFREIVRHHAEITDDDNDFEAWEKLKIKVSQLFPSETEEILPYIAGLAMLDIKDDYQKKLKYLDGEAMGRQVFLSSRRFFERLAKEHSLVLVFEDLHWADESSILLLEHLLPLVHRAPILMCLVSRPEYNVPAFRIQEIARKDYARIYTELHLDPLSPAESTQLIQNFLNIENLSIKVQEVIVRKAEGNPLFLEEIIRSLLDSGLITRETRTGYWTFRADIEMFTTPDSIQGIIMARVDRLDEELKQVLRSASIIGRSFLYRVLKGISEKMDKLDEYLNQLEGMELILQRQELPERKYVFKHALVQEAVYESILIQNRKELHIQVAKKIEILFPERLEEFYAMLAYHFVKGEDWDRAQDYLFKAGDQAGRIAADAEALEHYEQALRAYTLVFGDQWDPVQRASLERKMGEVFFRKGANEQATQYLQRALSYLSKPLSMSPKRTYFAIMGEVITQIGHRLMPKFFVKVTNGPMNPAVEEEIRTLEAITYMNAVTNPKILLSTGLRAINFSERNGFIHGIAAGYSALSSIATFLFFPQISGYYGHKSLAIAERSNNPGTLGIAYQTIAVHELWSCRFDTCIEWGLKGAAAVRKGGYWNHRVWGSCLRAATVAMNRQGNFLTALKYSQELAKFGDDSNDRQIWAVGLATGGMALRGLGRLEEAISSLKRAMELAAGVPDHMCHVQAGAFLANCLLQRGYFEQCLAVLEDCRLIARHHKVTGLFHLLLLNGYADVHLLLAEQEKESVKTDWLKKVKIECKKILKLSNKSLNGRAEAMRHQGTYEWFREDPVAAQKWWGQSLKIAEKIHMRFELGLTHLEMGRRLGNHKHLEQAMHIFAETGSEFELAQTRESLESLPS